MSAALASVTHLPAPKWTDQLIFKVTKKETIIEDVPSNAIVALRYHPEWSGVIAYDEFQQSVVTLKEPPWYAAESRHPSKRGKVGPWTDADSIRLQGWCKRESGLEIKLGRDAVDSALLVASEANPIDPPRDFLEGLEWDARLRVGSNPSEFHPDGCVSWLTRYLGVPDSPYTRWVGRWFLIASVARIMSPGCKVDNALVLEGPQGAKKSTAVRIMYQPWYSDTPIDLANKDRFSSIQGVWGYELAEFDAYTKHEASVIKAFVSSKSDKYRPPYLRRDIAAPRRCIFICTINPGKQYLQDETGGRRWWPVHCGTIDLAALEADRDMLWAEAVQAYAAEERWWPETMPEHNACREEQGHRLSLDPWDDPVRDWISTAPPGDLSIGTVLSLALGIDKAKWSKSDDMRVATVLRGAGYKRVRQSVGGVRQYVYRKEST